MDYFIYIADDFFFLCIGLLLLYLFILAVASHFKHSNYPKARKQYQCAILVQDGSLLPFMYQQEAYEFITPDNFYKTEADANAALTAVYNTFADEKSYRRYIWMGADFPGEAANANASAPSRVEMDNLTWTPTTDFCKNIWQISYSAIRLSLIHI